MLDRDISGADFKLENFKNFKFLLDSPGLGQGRQRKPSHFDSLSIRVGATKVPVISMLEFT